MVFLHDKNSGDEILEIKGENFSHLKARRVKLGDRIDVRNLNDGFNYIYEIIGLNRSAKLALIMRHSVIQKLPNFSVAWAVVEPQVIEKTIPSLNEMGVSKLILVYSEFSQKNIRLDLDRFERILIRSSEQCGRNSILDIEILNSFDEFLEKYQNIVLIDFEGENLNNFDIKEIPFVGPEGGFSQSERDKILKKYSLNSSLILRSNSAIVGVCGKILF